MSYGADYLICSSCMQNCLKSIIFFHSGLLASILIKVNFAGVEHVGGDMFESVPQGDAIFLRVS